MLVLGKSWIYIGISLCHWANFHRCKWPNREQITKPTWSHCLWHNPPFGCSFNSSTKKEFSFSSSWKRFLATSKGRVQSKTWEYVITHWSQSKSHPTLYFENLVIISSWMQMAKFSGRVFLPKSNSSIHFGKFLLRSFLLRSSQTETRDQNWLNFATFAKFLKTLAIFNGYLRIWQHFYAIEQLFHRWKDQIFIK